MVVDRKFIALLFSTFGLVLFFSAVVVTSLFMTRPAAVATTQHAFSTGIGRSVQEDGSTNVERNPASLSVRNHPIAIRKNQVVMEQFSLPCVGQPPGNFDAVVATTANQIQLKAKSCDKLAELKILSVTNKTNGYSATIFQQDATTIATDYITLDRGENLLTFAQQTATGVERSFDLTVLRK